MMGARDCNTGYEDAVIAIRHILSMTSDQLEFNDVLEYIYKNFGTRRFTESQEMYLSGIQQAFHEHTQMQPGIKSPSPHIQEGNIESGANSYNY